MPRAAWSDRRERQYEHIKDSLKDRGRSEKTAEQIAARTVNKERAQHGEAKEASPKTVHDTPAPVRGGKRSHTGAQGRTREQLYEEARRKGIAGRSKMNKAELEKAVGR
ncbi:plasmid stabilization protein [Acidovorax sp. PRC11]|uniref:plasmid stabilization protein n=1 Tax=Acidovorax sp. PRC11 TaxID=2962592 RepID=UPI0028821F34|nr:plasmid stabilization protein [Acidovorax sp. PRC11]MDT0139383.1 plasmid stabilization protein [Acidovorax sp. PRC11]